jgi:hypothetical protein
MAVGGERIIWFMQLRGEKGLVVVVVGEEVLQGEGERLLWC